MSSATGTRATPADRLLMASVGLAVLAGWELATRLKWLSPLFFPAPSTILATAWHMFNNGLSSDLGATVGRVMAGFVLGAVPALILGMGMGLSRRLRVMADPFIAAMHPLPKIAILPLFMIIFGIGETSKLVVVAVAAFFPVLINTMTGVRHISPIYYDVAHNCGASRRQILRRVIMPGSLPLIVTGVRLGFNMALLITISVELVSAKRGLGARIWLAWETFRTEQLYASLLVISLLGILTNTILQRIAHRLAPWQAERER